MPTRPSSPSKNSATRSPHISSSPSFALSPPTISGSACLPAALSRHPLHLQTRVARRPGSPAADRSQPGPLQSPPALGQVKYHTFRTAPPRIHEDVRLSGAPQAIRFARQIPQPVPRHRNLRSLSRPQPQTSRRRPPSPATDAELYTVGQLIASSSPPLWCPSTGSRPAAETAPYPAQPA